MKIYPLSLDSLYACLISRLCYHNHNETIENWQFLAILDNARMFQIGSLGL